MYFYLKNTYLRRISSSRLRFVLVVYVYVHSHQGSRAFLVLLVFSNGKSYKILRNTASNLRFLSKTLLNANQIV